MTTERHYEGGCLCGHIRFMAVGKPGKPHTCSCSLCQRHSGALTLAWVEYPRQAVRWTGPGGAPAVWRSTAWSSRAFCPRCGSTVGAVDDAPTVALVVGAFDARKRREFAPTAHSNKSQRPRWWHVHAGLEAPETERPALRTVAEAAHTGNEVPRPRAEAVIRDSPPGPAKGARSRKQRAPDLEQSGHRSSAHEPK